MQHIRPAIAQCSWRWIGFDAQSFRGSAGASGIQIAHADDLDAKLKPVIWALGLAILAIAVISGGIAWLIGRSISRPLDQLGARMRGLADGALDADIPGIERGDEVGAMAATVQTFKDNALRIRGLEKVEAETHQRAGAERRAAMENIADDFERSV